MLARLSEAILRLYRNCTGQPMAAYREWAMTLAKSVFPFDGGFWVSGALATAGHVVHDIFLHHLPENMAKDWTHVRHQDELPAQVVRAAGSTINVGHEQLRRNAAYETFYNRYHVRNVAATYVHDPSTGLYDIISFYRRDADEPFTEGERTAAEALTPHLIETYQRSCIHQLKAASKTVNNNVWHGAAIDSKGILRVTEPGFATLLAKEWRDWLGPSLPRELQSLHRGGGRHFRGRHIAVRAHARHDGTWLQAREIPLRDALTEREHEIATDVAHGLTYKEIALRRNISPSTVRNHLNAIYQKLGVRNKIEMIIALG